MNVTGSRQYSKATSPMRTNIESRNQSPLQHKLIFIYPMLFANLTSMELKDTFRSFLSKTFLREIFTSNYLNLVNLTNQITPFDNAQTGVNLSHLGFLTAANNNSGEQNNVYFGGNQDKSELQEKLNTNFELVKQYLQNDPIFKKLKPNVQIITLDNMINVPVIIGTAMLDLKMLPMIYLLMMALATNTTLDSSSNVSKLINRIKNSNKSELSELLRKQREFSTIEKIRMWVEDNPKISRLASRFKFARKATFGSLNKNLRPVERNPNKLETPFDTFNDDNYAFEIVNQVQSDIDQVGLFFFLVLNKGQLQKRYGQSFDTSFSTAAIKRISPLETRIFNNLEENFLNIISQPINAIFRSLSNLIIPSVNPNITFHTIFKEIISDSLSEGIDVLIKDTIRELIDANIKKLNLVNDSNNFKTFKEICTNISFDSKLSDKIIKNISKVEIKFSVKSSNRNQTSTEISNYMSTLDKISSQLESQIKKHYKKLNVLIGNKINIIESELDKIVSISISRFIEEYERYTSDDEVIRTVDGIFDNVGSQNQFIRSLKLNTQDWYKNIINYFFLTSLSIALCELVDVIDSEVEVAKHEVTDFPNYSLVLPIEVIYALHAAYKAKNLKSLFTPDNADSPDGRREFNLTSQYTRGMVKYLTMRLKIPNLIVYDEKRNEVFYKFMNMTDVNNTKLNAIKTFNNLSSKSKTQESYY